MRVPRPKGSPSHCSLRLTRRRAQVRQHALFRRRTTRGDDRRLHRHRSRPTIPPACSITSSASSSTPPQRVIQIVAQPPAKRLKLEQATLRTAGDRDGRDQRVENARVLAAIRARRRHRALRGHRAGPCRDAGRALRAFRPWNLEESTVSRRDARRDRLRPPALRPAGRRPVQRLHQDPFLEVSAAQAGIARRLQQSWPGSKRRPRRRRENRRQGTARRPGERLAAGRQPARAVVEVRAADDGPCWKVDRTPALGGANHVVFDRVPLPAVEATAARTWSSTSRTGPS